MENEHQHIEYADLTPAQKARVDALYGSLGRPMESYTYTFEADGKVWRYYKPSEACLYMTNHVMTSK